MVICKEVAGRRLSFCMTGLGVSQLFFGHIGANADIRRLAVAGRLVSGAGLQDAVRIDPERHLNLHISPGGLWQIAQGQSAKGCVVFKVTGLALTDLDMNLFWLSALVENTRLCSIGRGMLRLRINSAYPPDTMTPKARGVTSNKSECCS